jgi:hypothetical protein
VDKLRTTVQEGDFQVSTKEVFDVQMGWERGTRGGGQQKKVTRGSVCRCLLVYVIINKHLASVYAIKRLCLGYK